MAARCQLGSTTVTRGPSVSGSGRVEVGRPDGEVGEVAGDVGRGVLGVACGIDGLAHGGVAAEPGGVEGDELLLHRGQLAGEGVDLLVQGDQQVMLHVVAVHQIGVAAPSGGGDGGDPTGESGEPALRSGSVGHRGRVAGRSG